IQEQMKKEQMKKEQNKFNDLTNFANSDSSEIRRTKAAQYVKNVLEQQAIKNDISSVKREELVKYLFDKLNIKQNNRKLKVIYSIKEKFFIKTSQFLYLLSSKINLLQTKITGKPTFDEAFSAYKVVSNHFNNILQSNMNKFVGRLVGSKGSEPW